MLFLKKDISLFLYGESEKNGPELICRPSRFQIMRFTLTFVVRLTTTLKTKVKDQKKLKIKGLTNEMNFFHDSTLDEIFLPIECRQIFCKRENDGTHFDYIPIQVLFDLDIGIKVSVKFDGQNDDKMLMLIVPE